MRNIAVVTALALITPLVLRGADVEIARPQITFVTPAGAAAECKGPNRRGCTTLQTEFFCGCKETKDDRWAVAVRIIATPHVFTTSQDIIRHELEHIADVRSSLATYATSVELQTFASADECTSFIVAETKLFGANIRHMQRLTTIKRDGVQYASREGKEGDQ